MPVGVLSEPIPLGVPLNMYLGMILGMPLVMPLGCPSGASGNASRDASRKPFRKASRHRTLFKEFLLIIPLEICARNLFTDPSRNSERYPSKIPFRSPFRKEKSLGMYFRNAPRNSSRMFLAISLVMRLGVPPGML